jgi:hypothetical protein
MLYVTNVEERTNEKEYGYIHNAHRIMTVKSKGYQDVEPTFLTHRSAG